MKACTKCKQEKALDQFRPNPRYRGGHTSWCRQCQSTHRRAHYAANRDAVRAQNAAWYRANRERASKSGRAWYRAHAEARCIQIEANRKANIERHRERSKLYRRRLLRERPEWRLRSRLSAQIRYAIGQDKGGATLASILGYSTAELRVHLERQFLPGMGWHNVTEWHVDHIVPLKSFNLGAPEEIRAAWALPNLRPIWGHENVRKGARRTHLL